MDKKVRILTASTPKEMAQKFKEFEKNHTIVDIKYPSANMTIVFYTESLRFESNGGEKIDQERMPDTGRINSYKRDEK